MCPNRNNLFQTTRWPESGPGTASVEKGGECSCVISSKTTESCYSSFGTQIRFIVKTFAGHFFMAVDEICRLPSHETNVCAVEQKVYCDVYCNEPNNQKPELN